MFLLQHESRTGDVKVIGIYSTRILAEQAVARLTALPGFCYAPDGFTICEYPVDQDHWAQGF